MKLLVLLLLSAKSLACPLEMGEKIQGELVPMNAKVKSSMTEQRFYEILAWFEAHYTDVIAAQGAELKIVTDWKEPMANAFAQREDNTWIIRVLGGLARHSMLTEDAFILVLCHEMGHQIGGAPKRRDIFRTSWASNEGQADYFATLKCLRKIFRDHDNIAIVEKMTIPAVVKQECDKSFADPMESALCQRTSMASLSHAQFLNKRNQTHDPVGFETPDNSTVRRTSHKHPKPQCRLDTTFQGALCTVDYRVEVSQQDAVLGTCHKNLGHERGNRPSCWFRP